MWRARWKTRELRRQIGDRGVNAAGDDVSMPAEEVRDLLRTYAHDVTSTVQAARIHNVTVVGSLDLSGLHLEYDLDFTGCVFEGDVLLTGASTGSVNLSNTTMHALLAGHARVDGDLVLHQARIGQRSARVRAAMSTTPPNPEGDQVQTRRRDVDHDVRAPVVLTSSHVNGDVIATETVIHTGDHWAFYAPRSQISGSFIGSRLTSNGGVNLSESRLENSILLDGAAVGGVEANIVSMRGGFFADWNFVSTGPVDLLAMQAGNIVTFHGSELKGTPVAANLTRLTSSRIRLDMHTPPAGRLVLRDVHVTSLIDSAASWPASGNLDLEGLRYGRVSSTENVGVDERIDWLLRDEQVSAASFERLAAHYQAAGDERSARTVRLARERRLLRGQGIPARAWGLLQDALFGYGFVPTRALLWLVALVGAGAWWFSAHAVRPINPREHPTWDPFLYALDLVIPIVNLGHETAWNPTGADKAVAMTLTISGWLLATAVVAGARRILNRR